MPAKRLPKKKAPKKKPWILEEPDAPEHEPLTLTCTGCCRQVEQSAHSCPDCGMLFYQRPGSRSRRPQPGEPKAEDPDIAAFAERMETAEKWTRVLCILGGVFFLWLFISYLRPSLYSLFFASFCFVVAAVCFARGIKGPGADLDILDTFPFSLIRFRR